MTKIQPLALLLLTQVVMSCSVKDSPLMADIPAGVFTMGGAGEGKNYDEAPSHEVRVDAFRMSECEITNAQYELFDPAHKALRGSHGISTEDDDAVVMVSWHDANAYCKWLSRRTLKRFRLPTEAEWEYACRAGTDTDFWTGDSIPSSMHRNQKRIWKVDSVSVAVGRSEANPFGLKDMHGNVEEWCYDWYGPYSSAGQTNPGGPAEGDFKVTRGGCHNSEIEFLRSANRSALMPEDTTVFVGFRIVQSRTKPVLSAPFADTALYAKDVRTEKAEWKPVPEGEPVFLEPLEFVREPLWEHNHQPSIVWCDNGDLLAMWFSSDKMTEDGRECTDLAARLRWGSDSWDKSSIFCRVPDRNMTGCSLFRGEDGVIYNINGVSAGTGWLEQAMIIRESRDNGASWSHPRIIAGHNTRNQVIAGAIRTREGYYIQCCDNAAGGVKQSSAVHISKDGGCSWYDPWNGQEMPSEIVEGGTGPSIAGIHAAIVQLEDGSLMAVGRGVNILAPNGEMNLVKSISTDMGVTWTYHRMDGFRPVYGGQRAVLLRLNEGPVLFAGFTGHRTRGDKEGMNFIKADGSEYEGHGLFVALSYDEGCTWPVRKLLTDGVTRDLFGWGWTWDFTMDETHAEYMGYLAGTQTPDNMIHIISSGIHYRFNLKWIENL